MNALDIWHLCRRRSISVTINGDRLAYSGAPALVDPLLPAIKANRDALFACVAALDGALYADGPYLPWGPFLNPDRLKQWQRELFEVVDELARLEGWRDDDYDLVIGTIERQPISTLKPDLNHFRKRLDKARAASVTGRKTT